MVLGTTLGRYEIIRELAVGGMARIYLARVRGTAGFEKQVVLKCILESIATDEQFVTMFLDEARLAATLRHSNIAEVIDVGVERGIHYFAMEYIDGKTARDIRLRSRELGRRIPLEVSLAIVSGTAAALGYAHTRRDSEGKSLEVVHRDVSPSNIMVGNEGAIKLVDFGIARATLRRGRTRTGHQKGKVPYMSPEQCQGHAIDPRSDLFSLGTVLYELTTGVRPFQGNSEFMVMDQIVTGDPERPSLVIPDYPRQLEEIVMRSLARAPQSRYQTAGGMLEDLERFTSESSLLTGSHIVARYMKELFGDAETFDVSTPDAEATWAPSSNVRFAPVRRGTPVPFRDEPTRRDDMPPFDPIEVEILEDVSSAPDRVAALLDRAIACVQSGDLRKAIAAVELALDENNQAALQRNVSTITYVYEAVLDDPYRALEITGDLEGIALEPGARTLAAKVDGRTSIAELLQHSEMPRLEAYHHLCQLMLRGLVR